MWHSMAHRTCRCSAWSRAARLRQLRLRHARTRITRAPGATAPRLAQAGPSLPCRTRGVRDTRPNVSSAATRMRLATRRR
jgi:hypothetical protein